MAENDEKMSDKLKLWNVVQNSSYVLRIIKIIKEPGVVVQAFSSSTQEPAWSTSWVQDQPVFHNETVSQKRKSWKKKKWVTYSELKETK